MWAIFPHVYWQKAFIKELGFVFFGGVAFFIFSGELFK